MSDTIASDDWIPTTAQLPEAGVEVETKIEDDRGIRNQQSLVRDGSLWFFPDRTMYVYYTPTHWRPLEKP